MSDKQSNTEPEIRGRRTSAAAQSVLVLYALADGAHDGVSVRGIAETVGMSRSAAHRTLQALATEGFAIQDRQRRYFVGPRLVQLGARVMSGNSVVRSADEVMHRLVAEVGETAYLAILVPSELYATFVHRVESSHPLQYVQPIGSRIPLHAGAVGKAILASWYGEDPSRLSFERFTANTPVSERQVAADLKKIRDRGYATSIEERVPGAAGVAAPVMSRHEVIGAITVTVPTSRIPEAGLDSLGPIIARSASELSAVVVASGTNQL